MNQTSTTQQGLIKHEHGGLHSMTGTHGMRVHNSNKTADHHVRHSTCQEKYKSNRAGLFKSLVHSRGTMVENDANAIVHSERALAVNPAPDPPVPPPSTSTRCEPESVFSALDPPLPPLSTSTRCEPESVFSAPEPPLPALSTSARCEPESVISAPDPC